MTQYELCIGKDITGTALITHWQSVDCIGLISDNLNTLPDGTRGYNAERLPIVQKDVADLFANYLTTNTITDATVDPRYNAFQEDLLQMCSSRALPGVCSSALDTFCQPRSRKQISQSRVLANFCGCKATPDPNYKAYTNKACDPLCHRGATVQLADQKTGTIQSCNNTVCVIDDISINLSKSTVGTVTFQQICPGCVGSECTCIISGVNVNQTFDAVGLNTQTQFNQLCGTNSVCLDIQPNGTAAPRTCATVVPQPVEPTSNIIGIAIAIAILVIVAILLIFLALKQRKVKTV